MTRRTEKSGMKGRNIIQKAKKWPGTFQTVTDGTFPSDMPGTFQSDTGGTSIPLLSPSRFPDAEGEGIASIEDESRYAYLC